VSALALAAGALLAAAGLLVAALAVPVRIALRVASRPQAVDLAIGWPVPWLPQLRLPRPGPPRPAATSRRAVARRRRRHAAGGRFRSRALPALPAFLSASLRAISVERLSLSARFGAGDPALTGQIYGACAPLVFGTVGLRRIELSLEPDFGRACLSAEGQAVFRIRPLALAGPGLRFLWACCGPVR